MENDSPVIGIDLGTTNSVLAAFVDGQIQVIETAGSPLVPSIVGMTVDGKLVTGFQARNQLAAFPERTVSSIKRKMGQDVRVSMAGQDYSPQEISAIILRELRQRAIQRLGRPVSRAVITVPAFFNEDQRQATREAGELAGLTVERIINEPTAASLVYRVGDDRLRNLIIYDLGGGTFDVSVVRMESGVVEVLTSKGDTQLGGDDFDHLLMAYVAKNFLSDTGIDLQAEGRTRWRLLHACERAKCALSIEAEYRLTEEFIAEKDGVPQNLDVVITREEYESLIHGLVERTIGCVRQALSDSGLRLEHIDDLILVGGSTRTPLVQQRLREELEIEPRWAVNPDLAVALGAATQAAIQSGATVGPVLVDVATHSLGIEARARDGQLKFCPIIRRNSPLPATYEEEFFTSSEDQAIAEIRAWQGESESLSHNRSIGQFLLEGLNSGDTGDRRVRVRFDLSLDGTLSVSACHRSTGVRKTIEIRNATSRLESVERDAAVERIESMFGAPVYASGHDGNGSKAQSRYGIERDDESTGETDTLISLINRAESACQKATPEDAEDIRRLLVAIDDASQKGDDELSSSLLAELDDLLYYVAG